MRHFGDHFFAHTPDTLKAWCADRGMKPFRAKQILEWVYRRGVVDPQAMTNLSADDRAKLVHEMVFLSGAVMAHQVATDGTQKLLVQWDNDDAPQHAQEVDSGSGLVVLNNQLPGADPSRQTECVMIPASGGEGTTVRKTACVSSQIGCPVGCRFCASGLGGLDGNLSAGRIVEQVWRLGQLEGVGRISNVVFMGMGEPLSNLGSVIDSVRTIAADWGHGISARKITISTVGLPNAIERLADELDLPVTLALSLHAPNDELRRELIPWAQYAPIAELLKACSRWFARTGREITLEYILIGGINDQPEHAAQLAGLAKTLRANVNLIRYNEVSGLEYRRPETADVRAFQDILRKRGVNSHIRASRGRDIAAACGQLRHESRDAKAS